MRKTFGIALATAALVFAPMGAAEAHAIDIYQGNDWGHVNAAHTVANIHDKECDSNSAYMVTGVAGGFTIRTYDTNGCDPGGDSAQVNYGDDIKVCERVDNATDPCTPWTRIN